MACIFCEIVAGRSPASRVYEDDDYLAFMDIHPWRPGHLLVIPKQHEQYVGGLPDELAHGLWRLGHRLAAAIRRSDLNCDDLHFVLNDGRHANQSVPHVHLHLLPRWKGDFFSLLGQLARRPFMALVKPTPRAELDRRAAQIREALS